MSKVVILTATYNHADRLEKLYESLLKQYNNDFKWIIVDDGSTDGTQEKVSRFTGLNIEYIHKPNSGKSRSLNLAFDKINEDELVVIIDDDEVLDETAVETFHKYYENYYRSEVGAFHFHRRNITDGQVIANFDISDDLRLDYREFKSKMLNADGYLGYFGYGIKNRRFPVFSDEKYVGPGVMMMMVGDSFDTIWAKESIGTTEYLEGGITKQGRRLRVKSPMGMIVYCALYQSPKSTFSIRFKYSIMGYAYIFISGKKIKEIEALGIPINKLNKFAKIPGILLGLIWKKKYIG